jgi:hypothetical protein
MKKRLLPLLLFCLAIPASADPANDALHQQIRQIRRAYLDVLELLPTPEEIDWYVVYNQNGYALAADFLSRKAPDQWPKEHLLSPPYLESPERPVDRSILDKNVVYLSGLWTGEMDEALKEAGIEKFIKNALLATDERVSDAIDYMINLLTCRPSSAAEENQFAQIFNKVSLKEDEMSAWKTVLLHILEMHDCKYK